MNPAELMKEIRKCRNTILKLNNELTISRKRIQNLIEEKNYIVNEKNNIVNAKNNIVKEDIKTNDNKPFKIIIH